MGSEFDSRIQDLGAVDEGQGLAGLAGLRRLRAKGGNPVEFAGSHSVKKVSVVHILLMVRGLMAAFRVWGSGSRT